MSRWQQVVGALTLAIAGGAVGSCSVLAPYGAVIAHGPDWWAAAFAGLALLAAAVVGYADRILVRHRVVLAPMLMEFDENEIVLEVLLANSGNRSVALMSLSLSAADFGPVGYGAASAVLVAPSPPEILEAGEVRYVRRRYAYFPKALYDLKEVGEISNGLKRVEWKVSPMFTNSFGYADASVRQFPMWKQELTPDGKTHSSGAKVLYPIVVLNSWYPMGALGPTL